MYITAQEMINLFGESEMIEVTNLDDPSANTINLVRLESAIAYAESEINSYLNRNYTLPLSSVPIVLINKVADVVRWQLDSRNTRGEVRQRYEEAIAWLKLIAKGDVRLGLDNDNQQVQTTNYPVIGYANPNKVWTREKLYFY